MNQIVVRALELILCRLRALLQGYLVKYLSCSSRLYDSVEADLSWTHQTPSFDFQLSMAKTITALSPHHWHASSGIAFAAVLAFEPSTFGPPSDSTGPLDSQIRSIELMLCIDFELCSRATFSSTCLNCYFKLNLYHTPSFDLQDCSTFAMLQLIYIYIYI